MVVFRSLSRLALGLLLITVGCSEDDPDALRGGPIPGGDGSGDGAATYHNTIRALVAANCAGCHQDGGIGPFELASYTDLYELGPGLINEVTSRAMPPWQADPECRTMRHERLLSDAEVAAFAAWGDAGRPEGDPADYVAPPELPQSSLEQLGEPDLVLSAAPYTARRDRPDDYRCLPITRTFEADTFVVAADLLPEEREVVHHMLVFLVPPGDIDQMDRLSAVDAEPGYTCFGGPRVGDFELISGWVPGGQPQIWPEGSAVQIPAGYQLVMQMHYNVAFLADEDPVPEDQSELLLWTLPAGEVPDELVQITLFPNLGLNIEAGDPQSVHEITHPVPLLADVIGIVPHMHQLGTRIRVDLERVDGSEECLVDVPNWDFNWQQFYFYPEDEHLQVRLGDRLTLRCEYDNRPSNQPIINGERLEPRNVRFGEGTFDEMCLHFLLTTTPFLADDDDGLCGGFERCLRNCPAGDSQCQLGCSIQPGQDCASCTIGGLADCAAERCATDALPFYDCYSGCSDPFSCFTSTCAEEYDALYECTEPHIFAGDCDADLVACEVAFGD